MTEDPKPGATGEFPAGKMTETDEGAIAIKVASHPSGNVVIEFGTPVHWVGLPPALARELAISLLGHAKIAEAAAVVDEDPDKARH